jgi:hypothetical protein
VRRLFIMTGLVGLLCVGAECGRGLLFSIPPGYFELYSSIRIRFPTVSSKTRAVCLYRRYIIVRGSTLPLAPSRTRKMSEKPFLSPACRKLQEGQLGNDTKEGGEAGL